MRHVIRVFCVISCLLLVTGCEGLQKKFTRRPKRPGPPPTPIISFQDYTRAITPLDRYRKHALMFDYWNDELLDTLKAVQPSLKRLKRSSAEALTELETLQGLLDEERAATLAPMIEQRRRLNQQVQGGGVNTSQTNPLGRELETQTRQFEREFYWRDVEDYLKPQESSSRDDAAAD